MKVLGSAVLGMEAIVILLATTWASAMGPASPAVAWALGVLLMVLLVAGTRVVTKPYGVTVGWILQVLVLATAFVVPPMWIVGGVFAILWFFAVRTARRVDAAQPADTPGEGPAAA